MARIAVGGFLHETNTFAPDPATCREFEKHDGWPGLVRGAGLFDAVAGSDLGVTGFVEAARAGGHDLVLGRALRPRDRGRLRAHRRLPVRRSGRPGTLRRGLPGPLHGAMVTEHYEDGEGEILGRVRRVVGADLPLVASLDFHANPTEAMTELATALTIYRTYPHIDMDATGGRARSLAAAARLCCIAAIFEVERRPAAIEGADRSALLLGGAP